MKKKMHGKKKSPPQFAKKAPADGGKSPIPFQALVQPAAPGLPTMPSAMQQIMAQMQS